MVNSSTACGVVPSSPLSGRFHCVHRYPMRVDVGEAEHEDGEAEGR